MKRYFHASFSHASGFGSLQYVTVHGEFPSLIELKDGFKDNQIVTNCVLINIIEFNEQDFNDFIKK